MLQMASYVLLVLMDQAFLDKVYSLNMYVFIYLLLFFLGGGGGHSGADDFIYVVVTDLIGMIISHL